MGLMKMALRRARKILAWLIGISLVFGGITGLLWLLNEAGYITITP